MHEGRNTRRPRGRYDKEYAIKVWIDVDACTGDALCCELAPATFEMGADGFAQVIGSDGNPCAITTSESAVEVPTDRIEEIREAADECPGECIFCEAA